MDIRHRVGIAVPADEVYRWIATKDGLARWWTREVSGDEAVGGSIGFHFGRPEPSAVMEVVTLEAPRLVEWRCTAGMDEWVGTTVTFDLRETPAETVVLFTHAGWKEPVEFLHHCSTRWASFLFSMKKGLEGGTATPYPEDEKISTWG